eukprot:8760497-Pyramimonas_sp.AAC.2
MPNTAAACLAASAGTGGDTRSVDASLRLPRPRRHIAPTCSRAAARPARSAAAPAAANAALDAEEEEKEKEEDDKDENEQKQ